MEHSNSYGKLTVIKLTIKDNSNFHLLQLMKEGNMKIVDCNNHVKNAIEFFGQSCAVNSLINKYNPIGDNSDK